MTMSSTSHRAVSVWLWSVYTMVFAMVILGGITRLTGSGLSMVEWRPLMGSIPPTSAEEWQRVFDLYKSFPQYQLVNDWMTLADFKRIFLWEYLHRLFGRLIGVVFLLPYVYFLVRRQLDGTPKLRVFAAFVLGGMQGVLGWFMVKSGLVDNPHVSHFRLAAHLLLAFFVAVWILWIILDIKRPHARDDDARSTGLLWGVVAVITLQIVFGAFMAGTRAGFMYPTYPTMGGEWIPELLRQQPSFVAALFNHPVGVNFAHRLLGFITFLACLGAIAFQWRSFPDSARRAATVAATVVAIQFVLGIVTVLTGVSTTVAVMHQAGGFFLLSAFVWLVHAVKNPAPGAGR